MNSAQEHYVTLQSCASANEYPANRFSKFRNNLAFPLRLEGDWSASLIDISLPIRYNNVQAHAIAFVVPILTPKDSTALGAYDGGCDKNMERSINNLIESEQDTDSDMYHSPGSPGISTAKLPRRNKIISICRTARLLPVFYSSLSELGSSITQLYQATSRIS